MRTLGRYELLRPLARGGMAEVYLARRRVAGIEKRLVIKRLRRERIADPRFLDLFVKEAQLSMALVQQNIVPVFDFGRVGDDVFLAMEHIDGKDLGSSLARAKGTEGAGMPPLVAAFVAAECCHALHHAHTGVAGVGGAGGAVVVHRDVTPRNVLVSWAGEVKLADFGIAAAVGAGIVGDNTLVGTPAYLAPEQARSEPVDARTDLYSLGLVLWEMLVGERVRGGNDATKLLALAAENQLPPLPSGAPAALVEVIRSATASAPSERLASARAMADLLDSFIIGERARHGGPAPAQQLAAWLRERWAGASDEVAELAGDEGGAVATFLDDGAAGVLGTGTMRSMAVTAGPATAVAGQGGELAKGGAETEASSGPSSSSSSQTSSSETGVSSPADKSSALEPSSAAPQKPTTSSSSRNRVVAGAAIVVGLGALALYQFTDRAAEHRASPAPSPAIAIAPSPSPPVSSSNPAPAPAPGPPSSPSPPTTESPTSPSRSPSPSAAHPPTHRPSSPATAASKSPKPQPSSSRPPAASSPPVAIARRAFTIGARPWAHFTVDGDTRVYETPATVELTLGAHRVRYENPTLGLVEEVTITVTADGPASHLQILR